MRAHRRLALLVAAGAMAVGVGVAVLVPGVASAAPKVQPEGPYPAPPPAVTVNTGTVTTGKSVRLSGVGFANKEPVVITIRYRITPRSHAFVPPYGGGGIDKADGQGRVRAKVALKFPGYATITVKGTRSKKTASVTVRVLAWRGAWGGVFRETGITTGNAMSAETAVAEAQELKLASGSTGTGTGGQPDAELLAGMLGVAGLLGTGVVALRRRRA